MVLDDKAWGPNRTISDTSSGQSLRGLLKSVLLTDGIRRYELASGHDFEIGITTDRESRVSEWQVCTPGGYWGGICMFGPGSVRGGEGYRFIPEEATCPSVEMVQFTDRTVRGLEPTRMYVAAACGRGTWTVRRDVASGAKFELVSATTKDARNVLLTYKVSGSGSVGPIQVAAYRSPAADVAPDSGLVGSIQTVTAHACLERQGCLSSGTHQFLIKNDKLLAPDPNNRYVVVVGKHGDLTSSTYFRKYMLGAISHGFDRWEARPECNFLNKCWPSVLFWLFRSGIPQWERDMAESLQKRKPRYDRVIAYDWTETCALPEPGHAVKAGEALAGEILKAMAVRKSHEGDVVDLHLIGHSRGAVVVSEALKYLLAASPTLGGGFLQLTLLDPHPANNDYESPWRDIAIGEESGYLAESADWLATSFQSAAQDPPVEIPAAVHQAEVWSQRTPTACLLNRPDQAYVLNLWGMVGPRALIVEASQRPTYRNFERCEDGIGHNEVPQVYSSTIE